MLVVQQPFHFGQQQKCNFGFQFLYQTLHSSHMCVFVCTKLFEILFSHISLCTFYVLPVPFSLSLSLSLFLQLTKCRWQICWKLRRSRKLLMPLQVCNRCSLMWFSRLKLTCKDAEVRDTVNLHTLSFYYTYTPLSWFILALLIYSSWTTYWNRIHYGFFD